MATPTGQVSDDLFALAEAAYREGRPLDAAHLLESFAAQFPDHLGARHTLTTLYNSLEHWDRLVPHAAQFVAVARHEPPKVLLTIAAILARALSFLGRTDQFAQSYAAVRPSLAAVITSASPEEFAGLTAAAIQLILSAEDVELGDRWLHRRYPQAVGISAPAIISPVTPLRTWCDAMGIKAHHLEPAEHVSLINGSYSRQLTTEAATVALIPGAEILCGWDFVRTASGEVLPETNYLGMPTTFESWFPHATAPGIDAVLHLWPAEVHHIDADVLCLFGPERLFIGHWILDFLPRLRAAERMGVEKVAIPRELPLKHRELLALCGVTENRLIECGLGARYRFRHILAVSNHEALHTPAYLRFVRQALWANPLATFGSRIFLERAAGTRRIENREEFDQMLATLGFEYLNLANAGTDEQRTRLGAAEIVMCVTGSDPLACLFMAPGADLIELNYLVVLPVESWAGMITTLSGINFHLVVCEKTRRSADGQKKDFDFKVDCAQIRGLVEDAAARRKSGTPPSIKVKIAPAATRI